MSKSLANTLTSRASLALTAARRRAEDAGLRDDPGVQGALASIYDRLADVLYEGVEPNYAKSVVSAACELAEAIAGPQTQRTEIAGAVTLAGLVAASLTVPGLPVPTQAAPAVSSLGAAEVPALPAGDGVSGACASSPSAEEEGARASSPTADRSGEVSTPSPAPSEDASPARRAPAVAPVVRRRGQGAAAAGGAGGGVENLEAAGGGGGKNGGAGVPMGEGVTSEVHAISDLLA